MYMVNPRSKVAHLYPAEERCNTDQIPGMRVRKFDVPPGYRLCRHCEKRDEPRWITIGREVAARHGLLADEPLVQAKG